MIEIFSVFNSEYFNPDTMVLFIFSKDTFTYIITSRKPLKKLTRKFLSKFCDCPRQSPITRDKLIELLKQSGGLTYSYTIK